MVRFQQECGNADVVTQHFALGDLTDGVGFARTIGMQDDAVGGEVLGHGAHQRELLAGAAIQYWMQVDPRRRIEGVLRIEDAAPSDKRWVMRQLIKKLEDEMKRLPAD